MSRITEMDAYRALFEAIEDARTAERLDELQIALASYKELFPCHRTEASQLQQMLYSAYLALPPAKYDPDTFRPLMPMLITIPENIASLTNHIAIWSK